MGRELSCDILIVGGSAGGTAAALAAAEAGARVCLIEETRWLGGQLTTQGVCTPDEQTYIETFGATRRYAAFRRAARDHYRANYRLSPEAEARDILPERGQLLGQSAGLRTGGGRAEFLAR